MTDPSVLAAIKTALDTDPRNGALWLHYAELLEGAGRPDEALAALRAASEIEESHRVAARRMVPVLRRAGLLSEALIRVEALLKEREDAELRRELELIEEARGRSGGVAPGPTEVETPAPEPEPEPEPKPAVEGGDPQPIELGGESTPQSDEEWAAQFEWGDLRVTLDDVAGLDDVKRQIHLRIIAPFTQPEIYQAFRREGGGGIMLYGPPGCGKTYIARATAGELKARFVSVSIHDVIDKYWGESEKLVHALFEDARRNSPTVLFFDEFDALGGARGRGESQFWRTLVDSLLQEMDGVQGQNRDVLIFAATNAPWNVDAAFRRPGRFNRVILVTPPDEPARRAILQSRIERLPGGERVDLARLARETPLFTGADLVELCERATENALERSLDTGQVHEIGNADFVEALKHSDSTALEWLSTARNYARYSNEGGQYDSLVAYLNTVRMW